MEPNFIGYIKLKDTKPKQFLYTTTSNGGFFNIYVNFKINKKENTIIEIKLHIKNYVGTKYYFREQYIDVIKSHDNALRIGVSLTKKGNKLTLESQSTLNIPLSGITNVFFTRDESHFTEILSCPKDRLVEIANEPNSFNIPEINGDIDEANRLFKISSELFEVSQKLQDITKIDKIDEDIEHIMSVGNNCRVSYLEVVDPI